MLMEKQEFSIEIREKMFEMYSPHYIGIVLDIFDKKALKSIVPQIIDVIQHIEGDDRIYVAGTGGIKRWRGQMIASLATYIRPRTFDLGKSMQEVTDLFLAEEGKKLIFVFTDCYRDSPYRIKMCLTANEKKDLGNKIYIYGIGDNYNKDIEKLCVYDSKSSFAHLSDYTGLNKLIMNHYNEAK